MHDVFISYATQDKKWADGACSVLEQREIRCWIAPRDLQAGRERAEAVLAGIEAAKVMVVIFSASANASHQVRREVERAVGKGLAILPCRIENVSPDGAMEYALADTHWLDLFTPPMKRQMSRLADSVASLLPNHASRISADAADGKRMLPAGNWLRSHRRAAATTVGLLLILAAGVTAVFWSHKDAASIPGNATIGVPLPHEEGFVSLYDGKSLVGWHVESGDPNQWKNEGGFIVGNSKGERTCNYLLSQGDYGDFVLRFDFMTEPRGAGGVALRAVDGESVPPWQGARRGMIAGHPMIKLNDSVAFPKYPLGTIRWLKDDRTDGQPVVVPQFAAGQWHRMEVTLSRDTCVATIEGRKVVDIKVDTQTDTFVPGLKRDQGKIGFQIIQGTLRFRNIRIRELTPGVDTVSSAKGKVAPNDASMQDRAAVARAHDRAAIEARGDIARPGDPDRRAAEAVLSLSGAVAIRSSGSEEWIRSGGVLPTKPFTLSRVNLANRPELTDAQLEPLEHVSNLIEVKVDHDSQISDAGIAHFGSQINLQSLCLERTRITDAGLAIVKRFPHLVLLGLGGTNLTDEALTHLEGLKELRTLWLGQGPRVTDAGLVHLQNLTALRELQLWEAPVKGSGLKHLAGMVHLGRLALGGTPLTDDGLQHLQVLHELRELILEHTHVTDAGLRYLKEMHSLKILKLDHTRVTAGGVDELRKSLPGCEISAKSLAR
jgi:hypothetical protein